MTKYKANNLLIQHLHEVLGLSMREFCERIGVVDNSYTHWTKRGMIRILDLVSICNTFHIPFSRFVLREEEEERLYSASELCLSHGVFRKVVFQYSQFKYCCKRSPSRIPIRDLCAQIGCCYNKFHAFYSEEKATQLTLGLLLDVLRLTGLELSFFVNDPSSHTIQAPPRVARKEIRKPTAEELAQENEKLKKKIERMNARIERLEKTIHSMKSEKRVGTTPIPYTMNVAEPYHDYTEKKK